MKTKRTLIPLCAASLVLTPLHAASASEQSQANTDSSPQEAAQPDTDVAFDLSFPGGSFDDLLEAIAEETGRPPNAIVGENARQRPLPPFDLHSVTVDEVFQGLTDLVQGSDRDGGGRWRVTKQDSIWVFIYNPVDEEAEEGHPENRGDASAESTDARLREAAEELRRRRAARSGSASIRDTNPTNAEGPVTQIFQIGLVLERIRIEDLTDAIETAWETAGLAEGARLRHHEPTNLLFVRGTPRHVGFAEQIVGMVGDAPEPPELRAERSRLRQFLQNGTDPVHPMIREMTERIRHLEEEARSDFEGSGESEE